MKKILIATHNKNKFQEYDSILSPNGFKLSGLFDIGVTEKAPETGNSYLDIARNKAEFYSHHSKLPIIADTSGLEIHTLNGFPGADSHRWMSGSAAEFNNAILEKMKHAKDRLAKLRVVTVYLYKKDFAYFEGEIKVSIAYKNEGVLGFGYDPITYVLKKNRTLGQIPLFERNQISHRSVALQKLASYLGKFKPPR